MSSSDALDLAAALGRTRQSYDETPYHSAPVMRSHPARLAAAARWRGLDAPDAARARVLEIGCASGGNLLPLAEALPQASFLGVDLSPTQIAAGEARRIRYGLENIELRADSFEAVGEAEGPFDFIICHGVYSWIPEPLRDALMRKVQDCLSPVGIAFVSFNVLPGWRLFQVARDAMLLHARMIEDPSRRAEATRELFAALAAQSPAERSYGRFWRDEAQRMVAGGDSYLAHEIFEDSNAPETFADFTARAARFGLQYFGEAVAVANNEADLAPEGADSIRALAGGDRMKREAYIDIFSGRSFREALLVRRGRADAVEPAPPREALCALHVLPALDFEFAADADGAFRLTTKRTELAFAGLEPAAPAMRRLANRKPGSSSWGELVPAGASDATLAAVAEALRIAVEAGLLFVSTRPIACALRAPERPRLSRLAVIDAEFGDLTVTLRHSTFQFAPMQRWLARLVDGTRSRDDLVAVALAHAETGELSIRGPDGQNVEGAELARRIAAAVDAALAGWLRNALLVAP